MTNSLSKESAFFSIDSLNSLFNGISNDKSMNIIYFYADWAGPCNELSPIFTKAATEYNITKTKNNIPIHFYAINVDDEATAELFLTKCNVTAIPTIVIVDHELNLLYNIVGFNPPLFLKHLTELVQPSTSNKSLSEGENPAFITKDTTTAIANKNSSAFSASSKSSKDTSSVKYIPELSNTECERLHSLIHSYPIMIFIKGSPRKPQCGFTRQLVDLFEKYNIKDYNYFDIFSDESVRSNMKIYSDWPTFPQIYVQGEFVGGLDITKELLSRGEWPQLLSSSS